MENSQQSKPKYHYIFKWIAIGIAIVGVIGIILLIIGIKSPYDPVNNTGAKLVNAGGGLSIGAICGLLVEFVVWIIFISNNPAAKTEREEAARIANEQLQREIELRVEQLETLKATIDKTYIISTQERTVDAKYMAIGGYGQLNRTVQNTTTFLIVLKDGTKQTDEVPDGSDMYNIYLQHIDTSNLNGGKA